MRQIIPKSCPLSSSTAIPCIMALPLGKIYSQAKCTILFLADGEGPQETDKSTYMCWSTSYLLLLECEEACSYFPFLKIKWTKTVIQKGFHGLVEMMLNSREAVTFICVCLQINTYRWLSLNMNNSFTLIFSVRNMPA